jgi:DNA-binding transcriptional regulator/RsmH inhibitor MraZ
MYGRVNNPGPIDQAVSQSRLSLKDPYLDFLGNPKELEVTYGPMKCFLLHNRERREEFAHRILPPHGTPLDAHQDFIERRLVSGKRTSPVDDHGRVRIEKVHLGWAGLEPNSQAFLMPREAYGWIEVWNEEGYYASLSTIEDQWVTSLNALVERMR